MIGISHFGDLMSTIRQIRHLGPHSHKHTQIIDDLAVNYTCGLVVDSEHMLEAIKEGMALLPNYQSFIMSSGKSTVAEVASLLIGGYLDQQEEARYEVRLLGKIYPHL